MKIRTLSIRLFRTLHSLEIVDSIPARVSKYLCMRGFEQATSIVETFVYIFKLHLLLFSDHKMYHTHFALGRHQTHIWCAKPKFIELILEQRFAVHMGKGRSMSVLKKWSLKGKQSFWQGSSKGQEEDQPQCMTRSFQYESAICWGAFMLSWICLMVLSIVQMAPYGQKAILYNSVFSTLEQSFPLVNKNVSNSRNFVPCRGHNAGLYEEEMSKLVPSLCADRLWASQVSSLKEALPPCKVLNCYFNFTQSITKKIPKLELGNEYDGDSKQVSVEDDRAVFCFKGWCHSDDDDDSIWRIFTKKQKMTFSDFLALFYFDFKQFWTKYFTLDWTTFF